jgi:hypothetical protein
MATGSDFRPPARKPERDTDRQGGLQVPVERAKQAVEAYRSGKGTYEIAKECRIPRALVRAVLENQGVELRKRGRRANVAEKCGNCGRKGATETVSDGQTTFKVHKRCKAQAERTIQALK